MKNLLHPKWNLIINVIPAILLFFYGVYHFDLIFSYLNEKQIETWNHFLISLGILSGFSTIYTLALLIKKTKINLVFSISQTIFYFSFLVYFFTNYINLNPFSIPEWLVSEITLFQYFGTFLLPSILYGLILSVLLVTPEKKKYYLLSNLGYALIFPILCFFFVLGILPLFKFSDSKFRDHLLVISIAIFTVLFFFYLFRFIYILILKKGKKPSKTWYRIWIFIVSFVFPIAGLIVYQEIFHGIAPLGEFNNFWIYFLTGFNALILTVRNVSNKNLNFILHFLKFVTLPFSFYFFIVFLPILPFSVIAIFMIGFGFLMLSPFLLFIFHIRELSVSFKILEPYFSKIKLIGFSILGILIIPSILTFSFIQDKITIDKTLNYIYNPNYFAKETIQTNRLENVLQKIKIEKKKNRNTLFEASLPYISSYYNWIVLDNLTLSNNKIQEIESIFFDKNYQKPSTDRIQNENVKITDIQTESKFDETTKTWISTIDLKIKNFDENSWQKEYATTLNLPKGCWISDYYLYVGDIKEKGILAEKKSAMWIYSSIRNERKDPGILYYLTGNKIAFRVFPFTALEERKTGIELIHKEPITLNFDGNQLNLGEKKNNTLFYEDENIAFLTLNEKNKLKKVKRKPYFHFLIDASDSINTQNKEEFEERINQIKTTFPTYFKNAKISLVNSAINTFSLDENWKQFYTKNKKGGFYLDRAIRENLVKSYRNSGETFPIFITVTNDFYDAILNKDFTDLEFTFPENRWFYNLTTEGNLESYSLKENPTKKIDSIPFKETFKSVLAYQINDKEIRYLKNDDYPEIILKNEFLEIPEEKIKEKNWVSALYMEAKNQSFHLFPETLEKDWKKSVKYSFKSQIMNHFTSYLVVENESQKKALFKKQKAVLSGKNVLDAGEETTRMSEPSFYIISAILLLYILYTKRKKRMRLS
ncbi:MSEP-CTERM sorting domain-containing protein [Aureivirga marina]|uniref:MSEP-CTERM sorting domain-containing protein n=1 Tax=Aureivirga marina TaxID=1182451 RepID=UPI0018CBE108|nr:MSEP-CTERM sorting domain-containing protein [Aureivirga marina]